VADPCPVKLNIKKQMLAAQICRQPECTVLDEENRGMLSRVPEENMQTTRVYGVRRGKQREGVSSARRKYADNQNVRC